MIITRSAKRLMATVMTMALVVTGLVVAPKQASAAAEAPEVSVLGATLRLDGKSGKQSMRVGVSVANASQAKACGIQLTVAGKAITISTDGEGDIKGTNIYSYDEETDTVVYTAVIKDIPKSAFATEVGITGTTKAIDAEENTTSGEAVEKSIESIVTELQKVDSAVKLNEDGDLVREIDGDEVPVEANDSIFDLTSTPEKAPVKVNLDLSTYDSKGNNVTMNPDGSITVDFVRSYCGAKIDIPENLTSLSAVELSVVSSKDGQELAGGNQILFYDTEGKEMEARYGKGVINFTVPEGKKLGSIWINAQEASAETPQVMTIGYITLAKITSLDLNAFVPLGATSSQVNNDGSVSIVYGANNYTGSYIEIPEEFREFTYFEVKSEALTDAGTKQAGTQIRWLDAAGEEVTDTKYVGEWNASGVTSVSIPEGKKLAKIIINSQSSSAEVPVTQVIYYIKARA